MDEEHGEELEENFQIQEIEEIIFVANEKIFERKLFISQSEMVAVISLARSSGHKIEDQIMAQVNTLTTSDWSIKVKPDWPETLLNLTEGG